MPQCKACHLGTNSKWGPVTLLHISGLSPDELASCRTCFRKPIERLAFASSSERHRSLRSGSGGHVAPGDAR